MKKFFIILGILVAAVVLSPLAFAKTSSATSPQVSTSCVQPTSGPQAANLCFVDFTPYTWALASSGQPYSVTLPDGGTLTFTLTTTNDSTTATITPSQSNAEIPGSSYSLGSNYATLAAGGTNPSASVSYFALQTNGVMPASGKTSALVYSLSNISVTNSKFAIPVIADSETTDGADGMVNNGSITDIAFNVISDQILNQALTLSAPDSPANSLCAATNGPLGIGTKNVACTGANGGPADAMVLTSPNATNISVGTSTNAGEGFVVGLAIQYKVSFNTEGGSQNPPLQSVFPGGTATKPSDPTKPGNTFGGWSVCDANGNATSNIYDFSTTVSADTNLCAVWTSTPAPTPTPAPNTNTSVATAPGAPATGSAALGFVGVLAVAMLGIVFAKLSRNKKSAKK